MDKEYLLKEIQKYQNIIRNEQEQIEKIQYQLNDVNKQIKTLDSQNEIYPPKKLKPLCKNDDLNSKNESCQMLQTHHKFLQLSGSQTLQGMSKDIYYENAEQQFMQSFLKDQALQKALIKEKENQQDKKNNIYTEKKKFVTEKSFQEDLRHSKTTDKNNYIDDQKSQDNQKFKESMITSAVSIEESNDLSITKISKQKDFDIQKIDCQSFLKSYMNKEQISQKSSQKLSQNFLKDSVQTQKEIQHEEQNFSKTLDSKLAQKLKAIKIQDHNLESSCQSIQKLPKIQSLQISQNLSQDKLLNYSIKNMQGEKISLEDTIDYGYQDFDSKQEQEESIDLSDTLIYEDEDEKNETNNENKNLNIQQNQVLSRQSFQSEFKKKQEKQSNVKIDFKNSIKRKLQKNDSFDRQSQIIKKDKIWESNFQKKNQQVLKNFDEFFTKMQNKKLNTESNETIKSVSFNSKIIEEIFKKAKEN